MPTKQKERIKTINLFLSFAADDSEYSRKIKNLISLRSNLKLFSTDMLSAGGNWKSILRDEIMQCEIFILLLSLKSSNSSGVLQELGAAWALEKPIIIIDTHPGLIDNLPILSSVRALYHFDIESLEEPVEVRKFFDTIEDIAQKKRLGL